MAVAQALGVADQQLQMNTKGLQPVPLDASAKAAVHRMQRRARAAGVDLVQLLLTGSIQQWEQLVTVSFQKGMSLNLKESTIKQQVSRQWVRDAYLDISSPVTLWQASAHC
jgi:aryl carrier-like protein